jgi:hypothetical protein
MRTQQTATECIFNMDMSDLCGRTIKVSLAQQNQLSKLSSTQGGGKGGQSAIWSSDEWFQEQHAEGGTEEDRRKAKEAQDDKETLKD